MATDDGGLRLAAMKLVARAQGDDEFAARARKDPEGVLAEVGLGPEHLDRATIERRDSDYRGGALYTELCCHDWTCWTSDCPGTCWITIHTHPA